MRTEKQKRQALLAQTTSAKPSKQATPLKGTHLEKEGQDFLLRRWEGTDELFHRSEATRILDTQNNQTDHDDNTKGNATSQASGKRQLWVEVRKNTGDDYLLWLEKRGLLAGGDDETLLSRSANAPRANAPGGGQQSPQLSALEQVAEVRMQAAQRWAQDHYLAQPPSEGTLNWKRLALGGTTKGSIAASMASGSQMDPHDTATKRRFAYRRFEAAGEVIPLACRDHCFTVAILRAKPHPQGANAQMRAQCLERVRIGLTELARHYGLGF